MKKSMEEIVKQQISTKRTKKVEGNQIFLDFQ